MTDSPLSRRQFFAATAAVAAGTQFHATTTGAESKPSSLAPEPPLPAGVCQRLGSARFRELEGGYRFSPDSKWLAQFGGQYLGYELATGRRVKWILPGFRVVTRCHLTNTALLAQFDDDDNPHVYDRESGRERKLPKLRKAFAHVLTPDDSGLIQYTGAELLRIDLRTGKRVWGRKWQTDASLPTAVLAVTDKWVVAVGLKRLYLFDVRTGTDGPRLEDALPKDAPPDNHFQLLNFSADGKRVCGWHTGDEPDHAVVWDVETGKVVGRLSPHCGPQYAALSADGRHLFTTLAGEQDRLAAIDVRTGRVTRKLAARNVGSFVLSPDGKVLAALYSPAFRGLGGIDGPANEPGGIVRLLNPDTGEPLPQSPDPAVELKGVRFASPHTLTADVSDNPFQPATLVWDTRANTRRVTSLPPNLLFGGLGGGLFGGGFRPSIPPSLSPDATRFVSAGSTGVFVTDAFSRRVLHSFAFPSNVVDRPFWVGRGAVAMVDPAGLHVWNLTDHTRRTIPLKFPADGMVQQTAATADGRTLALFQHPADDTSPTLAWVDAKTGTVSTHRCELGQLNLSADGSRAAITGVVQGEGAAAAVDVLVIDRGGWRNAFRIAANTDSGLDFGAKLSPCGRTAFLAHEKRTDGSDESCPVVQFWEVVSGELRAEFATANPASGLGVSPCGRRVATTHRDAPVFLWDVFGETSDPQPKPDAKTWDALGGPADKAFTAVRRLVQHPAAAVELLAAKLKPAEAPKAEWVQARIGNLGHPDFRTRHKAELDLSAVADVIAEPLKAAFEARADTQEAHERLERLVQLANGIPASAVRNVRAVEALEYCDVPSAGVLLKKLAGGVESAVLTKEAKAAVRRRR